MRLFNFAVVATLCLALMPAPAFADANGLNGLQFVDAVRKNDSAKARQLLDANVPGMVDARGSDGDTALIVAINRRDEQWTGFLLLQKADPNLPGKNGDTPLIAAARIGFDQAAEWLMETGARIDAANRMGETPLIVAVQQHQSQIARALIQAGADPDKQDSAQGYSARDYAKRDPRARDILQMINNKRPAPAR